MDLRSAELNVQKLLNYIQQLQKSETGMYAKSKNRLRDISAMCVQTANIISDILKEEILNDASTQDYRSLDDKDVSSITTDVKNTLNLIADDIDTFVTPRCGTELSDVVSRSSVCPVVPTLTLSELTRQQRIDTLATYRTVLKNTSELITEYPIVNRVAKLIYAWFDARFFSSYIDVKDAKYSFHYFVSDIRCWLLGFILYIGNVLSGSSNKSETLSDVESTFAHWIHSIRTSTKYPYATPYPVYSICHSFNASSITLTSLVLWDMLRDAGYHNLCISGNGLFPQESDLYDICVLYELDSVLDRYRDYQYDSSILSFCNLN